jgi:hypothetical protein
MADNVPITPGAGANIAADEVTRNAVAEKQQIVKISLGADGAFDILLDSGQQLSVNSLPVVLASDQSQVPIGGNAADNAAMGTQKPVPLGAKYWASAPTYDDLDVGHLRINANGLLLMEKGSLDFGEDATNDTQGITPKVPIASKYSPSLYSELTQVTKANIKASAGMVTGFYITNDNAAVRYFQLHNKATAPAAADVPIYSFKVPAGTANNPGVLEIGTEFFTQAGKYFSTGIGWAISTTYATFTDSATNTEHIALVHFF